MTKYKIILDGDAEEYALYLCSCSEVGAEILNLSNTEGYEYDQYNFESPDYEIII